MENTAKKMNQIDKQDTRDLNGGKWYTCKMCGYRSSSYERTYANVLKCAAKRYGYPAVRTAWKIVSLIIL